MTIAWGALPMILLAGAATAGQFWATRFEQRTGKALLFFVPYEPWSRRRNPTLFKLRQGFNYAFVAVLALATFSFIALFIGLSVA
ncbi:hypothetical protein OF829_12210 [Sphingomonas sp. LB-2]|uniref:hypothetical protein n=1 Tax=Sphingomonas caeni TaxID=2984949 RepID=UPI0022310F51|nr:hypothetical protein [Sphingomonas caeni]MCW3848004.1 hypothetical protein [Sphingomonas caeni]